MKLKLEIALDINKEKYESKEQIIDFVKTWIDDAYANGEMTSGLDSGVNSYKVKIK